MAVTSPVWPVARAVGVTVGSPGSWGGHQVPASPTARGPSCSQVHAWPSGEASSPAEATMTLRPSLSAWAPTALVFPPGPQGQHTRRQPPKRLTRSRLLTPARNPDSNVRLLPLHPVLWRPVSLSRAGFPGRTREVLAVPALWLFVFVLFYFQRRASSYPRYIGMTASEFSSRE